MQFYPDRHTFKKISVLCTCSSKFCITGFCVLFSRSFHNSLKFLNLIIKRKECPTLEPMTCGAGVKSSTNCHCRLRFNNFIKNIKQMICYDNSYLYANVEVNEILYTCYKKYSQCRGTFRNQIYLIDLFTSFPLAQLYRTKRSFASVSFLAQVLYHCVDFFPIRSELAFVPGL